MSERKFYRNVYTFEVLSEKPIETSIDLDGLRELTYEAIYGELSGKVETETSNEEVDKDRILELLSEHGTDPAFFGLHDKEYDDE